MTQAPRDQILELGDRNLCESSGESIGKRCVCMSRVPCAAQALSEAAYYAKLPEVNEEAETKKQNTEAAILQSLLQRKFPERNKVMVECETLAAKQAAEGAEGASGEAPTSSDARL